MVNIIAFVLTAIIFAAQNLAQFLEQLKIIGFMLQFGQQGHGESPGTTNIFTLPNLNGGYGFAIRCNDLFL